MAQRRHLDEEVGGVERFPKARQRRAPDDDDFEAFTAEQLERLDEHDPPPKRFRQTSEKKKPRRNERVEEALRARLQPAGYELMFRDGDLYIDGEPVGKKLRDKLVKYHHAGDPLRDDEAFGRLVERFLPTLLKQQAKVHLKATDHRVYVMSARPDRGYKVMRVNAVIARLTATTFTNSAREKVVGPFWAPGAHWTQAAQLLLPPRKRSKPKPASAKPKSMPPATDAAPTAPDKVARGSSSRPTAPSAPPVNWPETADDELTARASTASAALREQRVRSDDFPVEIDCGHDRIVAFEPVKRQPRSGRLDLPFTVRMRQGELRGRVYLKSPNAVLSISIDHRDLTLDLAQPWALMLQVAADRYAGRPSDPDSDHSEPIGFTPTGATKEILKHWVSAHVTRLPEGKRASDDAVKAAEEVDIELPPNCTWTKGHWRGSKGAVAIDGALQYSWRPTSA
jgi:hypothetical protein